MNIQMIDVIQSAEKIVREHLALKTGERFAIIADPKSSIEMVCALAGVAASLGAEYTILTQPTRPPHRKNEMSPIIEAALSQVDALVGITGSSGAPTYSKLVRQLIDQKKLRAIS